MYPVARYELLIVETEGSKCTLNMQAFQTKKAAFASQKELTEVYLKRNYVRVDGEDDSSVKLELEIETNYCFLGQENFSSMKTVLLLVRVAGLSRE